MHICVCVKQTPDSASVYVDPITGQIDYERFVQILNPADACAVEAAVRLKEQVGGTVSVLTLGPVEAEAALRAALAIGADSALRLEAENVAEWSPFAVAAALAAAIQREGAFPDLLLCGNSSSDWSSGIVGPALAQFLDMPQVTGVAQFRIVPEQSSHTLLTLHVTRKLEHGYREQLEADLPVLLTVTGDMNEPRYPSLPAHLASLKATIPVLDAHALIDTTQFNEIDDTAIVELHTPRPLPKRLVAPDSQHSAYQRIGEIISGGATGRKARLVEGSPEELAQVLVEFLKARGFV